MTACALAVALFATVDALQPAPAARAFQAVEPVPVAWAFQAGADPAASQAAAKPKKPKKAKKTKKAKPEDADALPPDTPLDAEVELEQPAPGPPDHFVWKQHPSIRYGKAFRLDFTAKLQEDAHSSYDGADVTADLQPWELHRNRIGVEGVLFRHIQYQVERELTEKELTERDVTAGLTTESLWKDVYVDLDFINNAQVQVGKFKVPFGLDELTSVTHNDFVYRSLGAIYLAPSRDIGAMVHGRFYKRSLNYWFGGFVHDGDNARSKKIQGGDTTWSGRITGRPLRLFSMPGADSLELGSSLARTRVSDDSFRPNGLRGRTVLTQDTFFEPVYVKGQRWRWEGDVDWTVGPASVRGEFTRVIDERLNQGFGDQTLPDARYRSWYVTGTWILTGENKTRPVRASEDFLTDGPGAIEVAARVERIWFDSVGGSDQAFSNPRAETILPSGERALTLGVNWTLNRFMKLQFNAIREHIEDSQRSPVPGRDAFWSRVFRLQFVL